MNQKVILICNHLFTQQLSPLMGIMRTRLLLRSGASRLSNILLIVKLHMRLVNHNLFLFFFFEKIRLFGFIHSGSTCCFFLHVISESLFISKSSVKPLIRRGLFNNLGQWRVFLFILAFTQTESGFIGRIYKLRKTPKFRDLMF